jgi:opacity protein-like surface antigen
LKLINLSRLLVAAICVHTGASIVLAQGSDDYARFEVSAGFSHARVASTVKDRKDSDDSLAPPDPCNPKRLSLNLGADFTRFFCERRGYNGFEASATFNVTRYLGIKGNVSGHYRSDNFSDVFPVAPIIPVARETRERLHNFMGGVQVKDNSKSKRFKPYGHALLGVARQTVDFTEHTAIPAFNFTETVTSRDQTTSFAMKLGGGLDVRISPRVDLRVVEFNYNPIFAGDRTLSGEAILINFFVPRRNLFYTHTGRTAHNFTIGFGIVFR